MTPIIEEKVHRPPQDNCTSCRTQDQIRTWDSHRRHIRIPTTGNSFPCRDGPRTLGVGQSIPHLLTKTRTNPSTLPAEITDIPRGDSRHTPSNQIENGSFQTAGDRRREASPLLLRNGVRDLPPPRCLERDEGLHLLPNISSYVSRTLSIHISVYPST